MGMIEVITGGMYSGKTEELIRRVRREQYRGRKARLYKPRIDDRFDETKVVSHHGSRLEAYVVDSISEVKLSPDIEVVGIDEAQFFNGDLVQTCQKWANSGIRVILAGLDMDWEGHPFQPMPHLMAIAEKVTKLRAICMVCGGKAGFSYRTTTTTSQVEVGGAECYEARCRPCFLKG